jgi:hypothetical protein
MHLVRCSIALAPKPCCRSAAPNTAQVLFTTRGHQEALRKVCDISFRYQSHRDIVASE